MVYTSNADVLYRRKRNPFQGTSSGFGYGYGTAAAMAAKGAVSKFGPKFIKRVPTKLSPFLKTKRKYSGSKTTSYTKRARAQADPLGGTCSRFSLVRPKRKLGNMEKLIAIQPVVNVQGGRVTSLIGKQEGALLVTEMSPADITTLFTNALGGAASKSTKMLIKSCVTETMFTNMENVPVNYTLYDIVPKRDGNTTIIDPISCFRSGFADVTGGAAANYLVPGTDPYMNPRFNNYFQVVQRLEGTLLPGNVHTHRSYYEPNYIISGEVNSWTIDFIKDLTHYTMIIIHGTPENDSTTKTGATVSLSAANIDFVTKQKWTAKFGWLAGSNQTVTNNLPLTFAVGGEIMNEFTGTAQAEANA
jgi:hypothetical protein